MVQLGCQDCKENKKFSNIRFQMLRRDMGEGVFYTYLFCMNCVQKRSHIPAGSIWYQLNDEWEFEE